VDIYLIVYICSSLGAPPGSAYRGTFEKQILVHIYTLVYKYTLHSGDKCITAYVN